MLKNHNVLLLVADKVGTASGRVATRFGSDHNGIKPGLITIAKGLTSASGVIVVDKPRQVLIEGSDHLGSWPWLGLFGASDLLRCGCGQSRTDRGDGTVINARETNAHLRAQLAKTVGAHENVGDVGGDSYPGGRRVRRQRGRPAFFDAWQKIGPQGSTAPAANGFIGRAMSKGDILSLAPPLSG